jgi:hypothetical protein
VASDTYMEFFIPTLAGSSGETSYQKLRVQIERRMGRAPKHRRIMAIWTRRGSVDCVTTVGQPDPICGELVIAIFDMGNGMPFIVYRQDPFDPDTSTYEILGNNAYEVSEFAL